MQPNLDQNSLFEVYKSLFDYNHDACYALDQVGNFTLFNEVAANVTGYLEKEALDMNFISLVHEEYLDETIEHFKRVMRGQRERFETVVLKKDTGEQLHLMLTVVPIQAGGKVFGVVGCAQDITKKKELEAMLSGQNHVLEMIAKGAPFKEVLDEIIFLIEGLASRARCSIMVANQGGKKLVHGYAPGCDNPDNVQSEDCCATAAYLNKALSSWELPTDPLWKDYRQFALIQGVNTCWASPVLDVEGKVIGAFGMYYSGTNHPCERDREIIKKATDLTSLAIQHYNAMEKIHFMAFHDALTGLPNRRGFDERVRQAIGRAPAQKKLCLMFVDLDRFKIVNDSLGHTVGDKLLKEVSEKLKKCIGDEALLARQGGDEFAILLEHTTKEAAMEAARKILKTMEELFIINGTEIYATASVGMSFYPDDGKDVEVLLSKADVAMYQAKRKGKNNFQLYDCLLDQKELEKLEIENELRKALERNEFELHYQPIFNLCEHKMIGAEALIRWKNEKLGQVSPARFIPIAEDTGMIIQIGEWVLRTALKQLKECHISGMEDLTMSVNLSIRQFYKPNLIQMVKETLEETGIPPRYLTIEITESMTMDVETASYILHQLKKIGVNISIDDFGTGYSSLSYLKKFPIDHLKIDQCFIQDIAENKSDENIATTIILMAHNLGLSVIAEGVETEKQLQLLKQHHCNEAQGYYFSKPLPASEFMKF